MRIYIREQPARFQNVKLPKDKTWIAIRIHSVHHLHTMGDPERHGTPGANRQKVIQHLESRGIIM
eukprot:349989-Rhodomonas_salina.1